MTIMIIAKFLVVEITPNTLIYPFYAVFIYFENFYQLKTSGVEPKPFPLKVRHSTNRVLLSILLLSLKIIYFKISFTETIYASMYKGKYKYRYYRLTINCTIIEIPKGNMLLASGNNKELRRN